MKETWKLNTKRKWSNLQSNLEMDDFVWYLKASPRAICSLRRVTRMLTDPTQIATFCDAKNAADLSSSSSKNRACCLQITP